YWSREDLHGTSRHCVVPDGCVDIIFSSLGSEPQSLALVGLMTAAQTFDVRPGECFFGVRFRPGMAAAFMPDAARLNDRVEALENVIGSTAGDIFEQLAESSGPVEKARIMDAFLRPLKPPDAGQSALQRLSNSIPPNWAQLAVLCGYYDQAHFIR